MADMKISDLPVAPNVNDAQQFEVNDSGNSRRVTFQQLREKIKSEFGKPVAPSVTPASWNDLPEQYPGTGLVPVLVRKSPSDAADNNGPSGHAGHYYYVQQFFYSATRVTQLAIPYTTAKIAFRSRNQDGTWTAWRQVLDNNSTIPAEKISDASAVGRDVLKAADKAAARSAIGAGTGNSNLTLGTTATTAKPGNWKPNIDADTTGQLPYSRLTDVPDGVGGASYVAGDTYLVSQVLGVSTESFPGDGGGGDNQIFYPVSNLIATSNGTVRFRATQRGGLRVRLDGTQVAYWSTQHSDADRTLNLDVARGQIISVDIRRVWTNTAAHVTNARFLSATPATFLIPAVYFYIPPPPPPPPNDGPGGA